MGPRMRAVLMDSELCTNLRPKVRRESRPKNHKAGLVGPAVLLWNWFVRSCFDRRPRMSNSLELGFEFRDFQTVAARFLTQRELESQFAPRGHRPAPRKACYIRSE